MVLTGGAEKLPFRKENPFPSGSRGLLGQAYRYAFVIGQVTGASCLPPRPPSLAKARRVD